MSLTQENEVELGSVGSQTPTKKVEGKPTDAIKNMGLYHCMTFFPLAAICQVFRS
jgi:hypothetical protein